MIVVTSPGREGDRTVHHLENRRGRGIKYWSAFRSQRETAMENLHTYVLSENGELVKLVENQYEYTGMFILD